MFNLAIKPKTSIYYFKWGKWSHFLMECNLPIAMAMMTNVKVMPKKTTKAHEDHGSCFSDTSLDVPSTTTKNEL